jgi:hypothetical protein
LKALHEWLDYRQTLRDLPANLHNVRIDPEQMNYMVLLGLLLLPIN